MIDLTSYPVLVVLLSSIISIFFLVLLSTAKRHKPGYFRFVNTRLMYIVVFLLIIGPNVLYSLQHYGNFFTPDCTAYIADSNMLSREGHIPQPKFLAEDMYYAAFPIFTLVLNSLAQISGMSSTMSLYVVNVAIEVLFWLCAWCLLAKIENGHGSMYYVSISLFIVAYANPYLYGYFGVAIPQTLGISILLLLLLCALRTMTTKHVFLYILLSVLGTVHIVVIPFLLVIMLYTCFSRLAWSSGESNAYAETRFPHRILMNSTSVVFPAIVFASYVAYTAALNSVVGYSGTIASFFNALLQREITGNLIVSPGVSRGLLAPLNALATSFIIGANLALIAWYLYASLRKPKRAPNYLYFVISLVSVSAITIGSLNQRFEVIGGTNSISRYFALPGYALATIGALVVMNRTVVPLIADRSSNRIARLVLILILILVVVGGVLDPFAFRTQ